MIYLFIPRVTNKPSGIHKIEQLNIGCHSNISCHFLWELLSHFLLETVYLSIHTVLFNNKFVCNVMFVFQTI